MTGALLRVTRRWFAPLSLVAAGIITGCGGASTDAPPGVNATTAAVTINPPSAKMILGSTLQLQAQARDASGNARDVTMFWSSADTTVAAVTQSGVVTAKAISTAPIQIAASAEGQSAVAFVSVAPVPVASVTVQPSSGVVIVGFSIAFSAATYDSTGKALTDRQVVWASSAPTIAAVDATGKVTGVTPGSATITATSEGKSATATVTVNVVPVASVSVTLGSAALITGQTTTAQAVDRDASGNVITGRSVVWSSGNTSVATVDASGNVTAAGAGTTTIVATSEGKSGSAPITVSAPVASVSVSPSTGTLIVGATLTLVATPRDASGNALSGRTVTWSSNAQQVATVSSSGVVTAAGAGTATITATSEGKIGTATITVQLPLPAAVARVVVDSVSITMRRRTTASVTARVYDSNNNELTGRTITWSSSDNTIVLVAPASGATVLVVAGNTIGGATVTATSEGKHVDVRVTVTQ